MTLEEDIKEIKSNVQALRRRPLSTGRVGLYILTSWALINTCNISEDTDTIIQQTAAKKPQVQTANVLGAEAPEKFYDIDGQRVYLEIDGKPVAEYLKGRQ
ncbi:MAG: hypothetical protein WC852_07190 [Candidatus Nanoarchaeia archaeon]|jgi:hypothetical protein